MAERDTFVTVADGDQLNQGYYNGIKTAVQKNYSLIDASNSRSVQSAVGEASVASIQITANTLTAGSKIIITAPIVMSGNDAGGLKADFRVRAGTLNTTSDALIGTAVSMVAFDGTNYEYSGMIQRVLEEGTDFDYDTTFYINITSDGLGTSGDNKGIEGYAVWGILTI